MKNFFKSLEVLRRSEKIQIGSKEEGIFVLDGQRKKQLARCQISSLKILSLDSLIKSVFNIVKDFFKSHEVLRRSEKVQIGSKEEGMFVLDGLRKST